MDSSSFQPDDFIGQVRQCTASADIRKAMIASVVPPLTVKVSALLRKLLSCPVQVVTHSCDFGIRLDYPKPRTLGIDRLLHASSGWKRHGSSLIVVSMGTATTLDCITKTGTFIGGIIAPGPSLFSEYLHSKTALLPAITPAEKLPRMGRSTRDALQLGCSLGYSGMLTALVDHLSHVMGPPKPMICLTGGWPGLVRLPSIYKVVRDPDLLFWGLLDIEERNA